MNTQIKRISVTAEKVTLALSVALLLILSLALPILTQGITANWYTHYNQFIIGPLVNATLIYAGIRLRRARSVAIIIVLPSICAVTLGLLGISVTFMLYMIPVICLGNTAIALCARLIFRGRASSFCAAAVSGIALKAFVIFGGFLLLSGFHLFPAPVYETFYTMFGVVQVVTATIGAGLAYVALKLNRKSI
jgi:hypothetical protein